MNYYEIIFLWRTLWENHLEMVRCYDILRTYSEILYRINNIGYANWICLTMGYAHSSMARSLLGILGYIWDEDR